MKFIQALGLDYKLLLAQLLNFLILMFVLKKVFYKPLLTFMHDREASIRKGVDDAAAAKLQLADSETQKQELLKAARIEAQELMTAAREEAARQAETIVAASQTEAARVIAKATETIEQDYARMTATVKAELVDLVMVTTKQVLHGTMTPEIDQQYVQSMMQKTQPSQPTDV